MELILLRHGKAADHGIDGGDFSRPLVQKGFAQSKNAARILKAADMLPELVISSPLLRAAQTAETFTTEAGMPGPIFQGWLACGMSPAAALTELAAFPDFRRIMIVGHEPDFSTLLIHCLGAHGAGIEVRKGSLACIEISPPARYGNLRFLLPQKISRHME